MDTLSIQNVLDSFVPISRFNKGEAGKIFEEVKDEGYKIVVKNNIPACVLITPEKYKEMMEIIEDYHLLQLTNERLEKESEVTYSSAEVMARFGIKESDVAGWEDVEIE